MDGRGRLAQPLKRLDDAGASTRRLRPARFARWLNAIGTPEGRVPRGAGFTAAVLLVLGSGLYGAIKGDHLAELAQYSRDTRDGVANLLGFRISKVTLSGDHQLDHNAIFAAAGLTVDSSLPFFDLAEARARLKSVPWIADATLRKYYPGKLEIDIKEREPFARWQSGGKVFVVAADGMPLQPFDSIRFEDLPMVVGVGAAERAHDFLAILNAHPEIARQVKASVLVAERRWNLRLKNGMDVRLPETGIGDALATLERLDRERSLLSRDITIVDLRLSDRVTVQLSDAAAAARAEALKDKSKKAKKGSDA